MSSAVDEVERAERLRLITIPISPYCEKARWALERAGLRFIEEGHVQVLHYRAVRQAGAGRTVPVLVTPNGVLGDSTEILRWVDEQVASEHRLFPDTDDVPALAREVQQWEQRLDEPFGADTRLWAYQMFLTHPVFAGRFFFRFRTIPVWQRLLAPFFLPFMARYIQRRYEIDEASAAGAERRFTAVLDEVAALLSDGRQYLCGDRLTAADIAFASHCSALALPPEYGAPIARLDEIPARARERLRQHWQHPACEFARRIYREERAIRLA